MGFACTKEERDARIASDPDALLLPRTSDLRWCWILV